MSDEIDRNDDMLRDDEIDRNDDVLRDEDTLSALPDQERVDKGETAQSLLERIIPDDGCRVAVATVLADAIVLANALGPNRWAITIRGQHHLRLNVGSYVVAEVGKGYLWLTADDQAIDPSWLPRLEQLHKWGRQYLRSQKHVLAGYIRCHEIAEVLPLMKPGFDAFITACTEQSTRLRSMVSDAHASDAVDYIQSLTGCDLPTPDYSSAAQAPDSLAGLTQQDILKACTLFDAERRDTVVWANWERDPRYRYILSLEGRSYPVKEIVRIASGVSAFNSQQALRVFSRLGFLVEVRKNAAQRIWLFQANPRFYDLAERVPQARVGDEDTWTVTRYRDTMRPGDPVLLWLAGANAGIYALGELIGPPEERTYAADDEERPVWLDPAQTGPITAWCVPFRYTQILDEPIRKATLLEHEALQQLLVLRAPNGTNFAVSADEWDAIQDLIRLPDVISKLRPPYSLADCARDTGIAEEELDRWLRALDRKGQAVLYGPPGTGKTFVAERMARHLVSGGDGFIELVQFHPAYSYEDFIQGIRPQSRSDGSLSYPLVPGRFLDFCARAKAVTNTCVLIIDEINRANLARVFGELMYLLEYRDQALPLAGGGLLSIPSNVRIIGTMNTADRSIALVDHALRRRFAFLPLQPNYAVLQRYQATHGFDASGLARVLERINQAIGDPSYAVGISFFMRRGLAEDVEDIWRMEIEPYLEEYFFDRRDVFTSFCWQRIAAQVLP